MAARQLHPVLPRDLDQRLVPLGDRVVRQVRRPRVGVGEAAVAELVQVLDGPPRAHRVVGQHPRHRRPDRLVHADVGDAPPVQFRHHLRLGGLEQDRAVEPPVRDGVLAVGAEVEEHVVLAGV